MIIDERVVRKSIKLSENRGLDIGVLKFNSIDGLGITGYFCRPKTQKTAPCVVVASAGIHGSFFKNHTQTFDEFHLKWCWHLASNNIATLYIDKRGSYGYGDHFQSLNEIGGKEVDDIGIGVSALSNHDLGISEIYGYGVCRMCIAFLLAEIKYKIFKALFLESGFYDIKKQLLMMDESYTKELVGQYSLQNFPYEQRSPIYLTKKIPTNLPLLLVHGRDDTIVPAKQSIDFYQKLNENGHKKAQLQILQLQHKKVDSDPDTPSGKRVLKLLLDFIQGGAK